MGMIGMNRTEATVWWVTCGWSDCDFEMTPTLSYDEAEQVKSDHWHYHDNKRKREEKEKEVQRWAYRRTPE